MKHFLMSGLFDICIFFAFIYGGNISNQTKENKVNNLKKEDTLILLWKTDTIFKTPESVLFDTIRNQIYVSNINGSPGAKDNNGFISVLNTNGSIKKIDWIMGLNAPKGMGVFGNKLYVTDIDRIVEIDIDKSVVLNFHKAENAKFLNDITIDTKGNVFISDMLTSKIWMLQNGKLTVWLENRCLKLPNGLFAENGYLKIGTNDTIYSANLKTKELRVEIKSTGKIDGLEKVNPHLYIISDWVGHINLVSASLPLKTILNLEINKTNAADIDFVPSRSLLLIPTFFSNSILAYELK